MKLISEIETIAEIAMTPFEFCRESKSLPFAACHWLIDLKSYGRARMISVYSLFRARSNRLTNADETSQIIRLIDYLITKFAENLTENWCDSKKKNKNFLSSFEKHLVHTSKLKIPVNFHKFQLLFKTANLCSEIAYASSKPSCEISLITAEANRCFFDQSSNDEI